VLQNVNSLWNAGTGRFEVTVGGLYAVTSSMTLANRSASNQVLLSIRRNGVSVLFTQNFYATHVNFTLQLNAGDYLEVFASCPLGGATTVVNSIESHVSVGIIH